MQRLEVSGAIRPIYGSLGVKRLSKPQILYECHWNVLPLFWNDCNKLHTTKKKVMVQSPKS